MNNSVNDARLSNLLETLEKKNNSRDDADLETKFFNDTLEFLLSVPHWWCTLEILPIARESLWLFSLPDHEPIVQYKDQMNQQLKSCSHCAKQYQLSKAVVQNRYEELFPKQTVEQFFEILKTFDLKRVQSTFQTCVAKFTLTDQVMSALVEVIFSFELLSSADCDRYFCNMFDQIQKTGMFPTLATDTAPYLFQLSLHHHRIVRFWCRKLLEKFAATEDRASQLDSTCVAIFCLLSGKDLALPFRLTENMGEYWKALRLLATTVSSEVLESSMKTSNVSMPDLICRQLATPSEWLSEILKTMTIMLIKLQGQFWGEIESSSEVYQSIIQQICEHHVFQSVMKIAREGNVGKILQKDGTRYPEDKLMARIKSMLEWMYPYWSSLRQSPVEEQITNRMLDTTFGYFQMDSWGVMSRAYCAELGLQIIEQCLSDDSVPRVKIEEYVPRILSFTQWKAASLPTIVQHIPQAALGMLGDLMDKHTSSVLLCYQAASLEEPVEVGSSYQAIWHVLMQQLGQHPSNQFAPMLLKSYAAVATIDVPNLGEQKALLKVPQVAEQVRSIHDLTLRILPLIKLEHNTEDELTKPLLHFWSSQYAELRTWASESVALVQLLRSPRAFEAVNAILQEHLAFFETGLDVFHSIPHLIHLLATFIGMMPDDAHQIRIFWDHSWQTIAFVFESGLSWAERYRPRDVVDALIPVLESAQGLMQSRSKLETYELAYNHVQSSTDALSHWIYVTRQDVIRRLMPLLIDLLSLLTKKESKVSVEAYDRLMAAATGVNSSKLSANEKERLFMSLSAHEPSHFIFLNDSDDEEVAWQTVHTPVESHVKKSAPKQMTLDQSFAQVGLRTPPRQAKITRFFETSQEAPYEISDDDEFAEEYGALDIAHMMQEGLLDEVKPEPMAIDPPKIQPTKAVTKAVTKTTARAAAAATPIAVPGGPSRARVNPVYSTQPMAKPKEGRKGHAERVYVPTNQPTYSVTSTGRRLKPPPMGFSKIKSLREELRAEQRMMATAKSPSSALHRRYATEQSSSDSSEDEEGGLEGLVSLNDRAANVRAESASLKALFDTQPKRKVQMIDNPTHQYMQQKEQRQRAQVRRQKLAPKMDALYKTVFGWDLTVTGESPPGQAVSMRVPSTFASFQAYKQTFEPLLMAESWSQMQRAREGLSASDVLERCMVSGRCHTNDFVDISFMLPMHQISSHLSTDDLVCVANHFGSAFFEQPDQLTEGDATQKPWRRRAFLGKVMSIHQSKSMGEVCIRSYFTHERITVLNAISPKTLWSVLKVMSLTTLLREYAALEALEHYELGACLLSPKPSGVRRPPASVVQQYQQTYHVNTPQAEAIASALEKRKGFSLIQGPPGTGKTKTILALILALLEQQPQSKLLVSAPSNAAVDEITKRLKEGVRTSGGLCQPNVVRIGVADAVHSSVKDRILDRLVESEMETGNDTRLGKIGLRLDSLHNEIRNLQIGLDDVDREITQAGNDMGQMSKLRSKRKELGQQLVKAKSALREAYQEQKNYGQEMEVSRVRARQKVFAKASVVCATLSGSGHDMLTGMGATFDTVIVDEAAQSIELSSLIPLKFDTQRCILVGDPEQLPPTVMSTVASQYGYPQSLFMRLEKSMGKEVSLLSIQYRMHPEISAFPSRLFYQSRLQDGENMASHASAVWHALPSFPPYCFYDIQDGQEKVGRGKSVFNVAEADAAVALVDSLVSQLPTVKFASKIGVITPYKQQVGQLKARFQKRFGTGIVDVIDFNTVDGFQGQEKEIILFSCVRAGSGRGIGFLADQRRMNVGLTRAKCSLFVLGHAQSLAKSDAWGDLVKDAQARALIRSCTFPYFPPLSTHIPANLYLQETMLPPPTVVPPKGPVKIEEPPLLGSKRPAGQETISPPPTRPKTFL
ncbi:hypothetical protein BY458DRAFT_527126 [Sporodiniella umbellata]|nr:hypothetical protein BY458DRAFT_527126 [Sporodiniella umbellata]